MNTSGHLSLRFTLAAGAITALAALPQSASAQLVGSFMRSGAVTQSAQNQSPSGQQPIQMRPGPIVRGASPVYRGGPTTSAEPVYSSGPIYGRGPIFNPQPSFNQQPVYTNPQPGFGRGGNYYYNYGNGYSSGPVVTLPAEPYYPSYGGGTSYGQQPYLPPVGPANGFFRNPIPPVGPGNGFFSGQAPVTGGGPALLGGYYYGNYCNVGTPVDTYPSVYSGYDGFPHYIYSSNVTVIDNSYNPVYTTPYLPFNTPVYQTNYNQNNYYVATEGRVEDLQAGGVRAKDALQHAYPASSFQAAFADIAHAWTDGDISLVRSHLRNADTRVSVFLDGKYSYSIASSDYSQITRDALDRLHTVSFNFTRLRKAKNGDVTAYGAHVYRVTQTGGADDNGTVPFDQAGTDTNASPYDQSGDPALGAEKTVYISYTLRRYGTEWDIVATDSANHDLAASAAKTAE